MQVKLQQDKCLQCSHFSNTILIGCMGIHNSYLFTAFSQCIKWMLYLYYDYSVLLAFGLFNYLHHIFLGCFRCGKNKRKAVAWIVYTSHLSYEWGQSNHYRDKKEHSSMPILPFSSLLLSVLISNIREDVNVCWIACTEISQWQNSIHLSTIW